MKTPDWIYLVMSEFEGRTTVINAFYDGKAAEINAKEWQEVAKRELIYVIGKEIRKDRA